MASSTTKTQRIVSLILAIVFLISSIGAVAYYVLASGQAEKDQAEQAKLIAEFNKQNSQQQIPTPTVSASPNTAASPTPTKQEDKKLEGTKLANYQPVTTVAKLLSTDLALGSGTVVKISDTVTVHYTGALAKDGTIFQSSLDNGQPASFGLNQVIKGWTQGIPGMQVGGIRRLLIPASLAYGANPPAGSNIPANADLVFDVQLIKIGN